MDRIRNPVALRSMFAAFYAATIFFSFHWFITIYINSSFIATLTSEYTTSILFIVGSALTVLALLFISRFLKRFGNYSMILAFAILEFYIVLGMAVITVPWVVATLFIALLVTSQLILYHSDIFLESYSTEEGSTGIIRGAYMTVINIALIFSPFLAGFVLGESEAYWKIYLLSAIFLLPFIVIIASATRDFKDASYRNFELRATLGCLFSKRDVLRITTAQFLLQVFFSWTVIYIPLYLTQHLGFTWEQFGVLISIALFAYLLFEWPLAWLADTRTGEKELLILGFVVLAITCAFMSLFPVVSLAFWATLMFVNRSGAAMVDMLTESYFFKQVSGGDANTVSCYRMARPMGYIAGPVIASVALLWLNFSMIFYVMSGCMVLGALVCMLLKDTK